MRAVTSRDRGRINAPVTRPTAWWLATLKKRAASMYESEIDFSRPVEFNSPEERNACIAFFNAAYRAEESGLSQAHRLADQVREWDHDLAECLVLYGNEEGWHRELLTKFMENIGGEIRPMGRVTGTFYRLYDKAEEMETIMLTNLMFETIGSTTYRLALGRVEHPTVRSMLAILTRDESFHVPLNVHFIREILKHKNVSKLTLTKLKVIYYAVFMALIASTAASREVAQKFDRIAWRELATAYVENLGQLFLKESDLQFEPPWMLLRAFGINRTKLEAVAGKATSIAVAEESAIRENVQVTAL